MIKITSGNFAIYEFVPASHTQVSTKQSKKDEPESNRVKLDKDTIETMTTCSNVELATYSKATLMIHYGSFSLSYAQKNILIQCQNLSDNHISLNQGLVKNKHQSIMGLKSIQMI